MSGQDCSGLDLALPDPVVEPGEDHVGPVDLVARGGEVLPDRAQVGTPVDGVFQQPGGLRLVRVGARAGVPAQLGLEERVDGSGVDEVDQAVGEVAFLGAGGQPDGQPPGSDVVDDGAAAVGVGDAVVDEPLVHRQVGQRAVRGQPVAGSGREALRPLSVSYIGHAVFLGGSGHAAAGAAASCASRDAACRWSVGCLAVWLPAGLFVLAVDVAGRLGSLGDRVGRGQAEFGGPALDEWPEPVSLGQVAFGGVSAKVMAVIACCGPRSGRAARTLPSRSGRAECRAVWAVWSLVMICR